MRNAVMDTKEETDSANARAHQLSVLRSVEETIKKSKKSTEPKYDNEKRTKTYTRKIAGVKMTTMDLPKGSTAFQQVLEEIHKEMEEMKHTRVDEEPKSDHTVKVVKDHGRHHLPSGPSSNFYRTQSVSGGYSGAFVRNQTRKLLLKSKSSREILLEKLDIIN